MSMNVNVQENWVVEPELTEMPPRRVVPSEYPDLNRPNSLFIYGGGGVAIVAGIVVLIIGLNIGNITQDLLGVLLALVGLGIVVFLGPQLTKKHLDRGERLCKIGVPVMARLLEAENMSGDYRFGRTVTYQVALPNGDMVHRNVNADDRLLPRKIPANITALLDMETNDVELYCALPFRAMLREGSAAAKRVNANPLDAENPLAAQNAVTPAHTPGKMSTIEIGDVPQGGKREKVEEKKPEEKKTTRTGSSGLPWE